jgi:Tat protein translocase TatB subunit
MFGIGVPEMVVILVVALIVLGPKRLPEVARALGKGLAEFRKVTGDVNRELEAARNMIEAEAREHENAARRAAREARAKPAADEAQAASAEPPLGPRPTTDPPGGAPGANVDPEVVEHSPGVTGNATTGTKTATATARTPETKA